MQHQFHFVQPTSREAFASIQGDLPRVQSIVMDYARERGDEGFIDHELADRHPELGYNVRATRNHLVAAGLLVDTGTTRKPDGSSRRCIVWAVA